MSASPSKNTDEQSNSDTTTDWPPDGSDSQGGRFPWKILLVGVLIATLVAWFVRPWLQGIIYALYTTPLFLVALIAGLIAGWGYYRYEQAGASTTYSVGDGDEQELTPLRVAGIVFVVGLIALTPVVNTIAGATLSDQTMAEATTVERLDDVDAEKPRIVTRAVADRYASNTLNRPQYRVGDTDISVANGTPYWAAPLSPDGLFNKLTKRQAGTVLVDMTTQQANVRIVDGELETGIGTIFYESYRWHLLKNQEYLVSYGDPKMIVNNGTQYIVVPYSTPTFHLTPLPHSTPKWGGVAVIDPSGSIEMLSPEEAAQNPILASQQLYPEDLARRKVASTKYRNGILNTYTSHEDEIEIAPVPGDGNDQPFFVLSEEGPQYMVAVEPYGEAQGLREVWTIDGQTGAFEIYRPNESLFGPQKAADLVRQSAPQTDWNRFSPAEPILAVIDDREYWQVRIVPEDNSGIAYVAFVDAQTSDVEEFEDTDAIKQFLAGETPVESPDQPGDGEDEETPTVIVQRVDENGTVIETMEIYGNESVRIETNPNGSATTATNTTTSTSTDRLPAPL